MPRILTIAIFLVHAGLITPARAQSTTEAEALFQRGTELYATRKLDAAIESFIASNRIAPNANAAFNIAQTYELLGRFAEAFNWYQSHLEFALETATRERAQQRAMALFDKIAVLDVRARLPGGTITLDEVEAGSIGPGTRLIAVLPGRHTIVLRLAITESMKVVVDAAIGSTTPVVFEPPPRVARIAVSTKPAGARVLRESDGTLLGTTPCTFSTPSGTLVLSVRLDGHTKETISTSVAPDQLASFSLTLRPVVSVGLRSMMPRVTDVQASDEQVHGVGDLRWAGYGAAAAFLIAGLAQGGIAISQRDAVETQADANRLGQLNLAADLTVGTAILTAGITFLLDMTLNRGPSRHRSVDRADTNGSPERL